MHRELCAHSPTGAQSAQAKARQAPARARPQAMPERARGWAMAVGAEQPPSARPGERCKPQASVAQSHQPFCRRQTSLIHRKSRFSIAIGKRRLRHRMRLFALINMVCSDLAYCNASSLYCKSMSGAPWRAATGCHACTPCACVWLGGASAGVRWRATEEDSSEHERCCLAFFRRW